MGRVNLRKNETGRSAFDCLPTEVLRLILAHCSIVNRIRASGVCKLFRDLDQGLAGTERLVLTELDLRADLTNNNHQLLTIDQLIRPVLDHYRQRVTKLTIRTLAGCGQVFEKSCLHRGKDQSREIGVCSIIFPNLEELELVQLRKIGNLPMSVLATSGTSSIYCYFSKFPMATLAVIDNFCPKLRTLKAFVTPTCVNFASIVNKIEISCLVVVPHEVAGFKKFLGTLADPPASIAGIVMMAIYLDSCDFKLSSQALRIPQALGDGVAVLASNSESEVKDNANNPPTLIITPPRPLYQLLHPASVTTLVLSHFCAASPTDALATFVNCKSFSIDWLPLQRKRDHQPWFDYRFLRSFHALAALAVKNHYDEGSVNFTGDHIKNLPECAPVRLLALDCVVDASLIQTVIDRNYPLKTLYITAFVIEKSAPAAKKCLNQLMVKRHSSGAPLRVLHVRGTATECILQDMPDDVFTSLDMIGVFSFDEASSDCIRCIINRRTKLRLGNIIVNDGSKNQKTLLVMHGWPNTQSNSAITLAGMKEGVEICFILGS